MASIEARIEQLTDANAVSTLTSVAKRWVAERPTDAVNAVMGVVSDAGSAAMRVAESPVGRTEVTPETANLSRAMLVELASGNDDEVIVWVEDAVSEAEGIGAQVIDPISLGIIGGIIIGSILAARVKKIGPIKFYKGVPKELGDVLSAAGKFTGRGY
jgi:hypothetical protein